MPDRTKPNNPLSRGNYILIREQSMPKPLGFVYLDHNVLNDMHDGLEGQMLGYIRDNRLQSVYSDQNLDEICASVKRKEYFIELLNNLNALHINSPLDNNLKATNSLNISGIKPQERIQELEDSRSASGITDDGMEHLSKLFGGNEGVGIGEFWKNQLDEAVNVLKDLPEVSGGTVDLETLTAALDELQDEASDAFKKMDDELETNGSPFAPENIKTHIGFGTDEISSVEQPRVIIKLWKMIGHVFGNYPNIEDYQKATLELSNGFFGLHGTTELSSIQKANDLYLWLNIVGFHRDEKIRRARKMRGSNADMNHASYAMTCCSHFLCSDRRLRLKAEAIYEHLNVQTQIVDTRKLFKKVVPG